MVRFIRIAGSLLLCTFGVFSAWAADSGGAPEIAAIYSLTGEAAEGNKSSVQGVRIAVDEINSRGGLLGKKVGLKVIDNESTPIGSHIAAQRASDAGVIAIIGASWSTHSLSIAEVAQARGIPMISSFSTSPELTWKGDFIFRACFTDEFQGKALARFVREDLEAKTASIFVNLNSEYSMGLSRLFREHFERAGGKVVYEAEYKPRQKNFDDIIQGAVKARADVLFLPGYDESGAIAVLAQKAGVRSIPVGGDGWADSSFLARGGSQLKLAYHGSHWSDAVDSDVSRAFVKKYRDMPYFDTGMVLAYDAVMVLADAVVRAGSFDRKEIRDALSATRSFRGVTGEISFNEHSDPVKSVVIVQIRDGKPSYFKTLSP